MDLRDQREADLKCICGFVKNGGTKIGMISGPISGLFLCVGDPAEGCSCSS